MKRSLTSRHGDRQNMGEFALPRRSYLKLTYNGVDATDEFDSEAFEYNDSASGEADTISLTVNNQTGKWVNNYMPHDGDYVDAQICVENWTGDGDNRSVACGQFELDSFKASGFPSVASLKGISIPIRRDFNVTAKNKNYSSTTVKSILSEICSDAGIELVYESADYGIEETEQSGKTDMAFAFELCADHNLAMKIYNNKLVVYDQTDYEKKPAAYSINLSEMQKYTYNCTKSQLYDGVEIQYTNPDSDDTLTYSYSVPGTEGKRKLFINEQVETYREAEIRAKSRLLENIRAAVSLSVTVKGDTKHMAARNVNITGLGKLDGVYFVDSVVHSKSAKGAYTCRLNMHLCVTHTTFSDAQASAEPETASGTTYVVKTGDCLWSIARGFYGSGAKYTIIFNANRDIIKDPSLIYPGQVLKIPAE